LTRVSSFQEPVSYTQRVHTGRNTNVKVALAFIKAHHNIKVLGLLHSRICEYINIFSFDYY